MMSLLYLLEKLKPLFIMLVTLLSVLKTGILQQVELEIKTCRTCRSVHFTVKNILGFFYNPWSNKD